MRTSKKCQGRTFYKFGKRLSFSTSLDYVYADSPYSKLYGNSRLDGRPVEQAIKTHGHMYERNKRSFIENPG